MARPTVYLHLDESCLGNQFRDRARPGGAGGLVETWREGEWTRREFWLSEPDTTNNRMALRSAIEALGSLKSPCTVHLVSDSVYLIKGISEWLPAWKRRGWKRKGGPIENLSLWRELDAQLARHDQRARWVRGHDGHPENSYADMLATCAAAEQSSSDGLRRSGFVKWLERQRELGFHLDYLDSAPPEERFANLG